MVEADLPAVSAVAAAVHPGYPEEDAVFEERFRLFPEGCFMLEAGGRPVGYAIGHPWLRGQPPALNTLLRGLPGVPSTFYLHDVALLPDARSGGAGTTVAALMAGAAKGLACISLVAISGTGGFWERQGFREMRSQASDRALKHYGPGARYMERTIPASFDPSGER
jgi:ribosomal protein S18 acetylase RimI-like enzyme